MELQIGLVDRDVGSVARREAAIRREDDARLVDMLHRMLDAFHDGLGRVDHLASTVHAPEADAHTFGQLAQAARVATPAAQSTAVVVQVDTVAVSPIPDMYRATGTVRARQVAAIAAKIAANVLDVRVHAGDRVQAGQTLIVLDRRDLEANLRRAEAARSEAESAAIETEDGVTSARASVELARLSHKRVDDLLANALVSRQVFDESHARLENAEAALQMAISRQRELRFPIDEGLRRTIDSFRGSATALDG